MTLTIRPLGEALAAEVIGFNLKRDLNEDVLQEIRKAWNDHIVLCFRDQDLTPEDFIGLAEMFGEIMPQVVKQTEFSLEGYPQIGVLKSDQRDTSGDQKLLRRGEGWHTDHSHSSQPPAATMVYGVRVPDVGGDTCFANTRAAYDALSAPMKTKIDNLKAFHAYESRRSPRKMPTRSKEEEKISTGSQHPLARTHPDTGKKAIYLNPIRIDGIVGMEDDDAFDLLNELLEHATQERFQYRHKWSPHDVIIWDNRCALHAATFDYDPDFQRTLHRTMIRGEAPF